MRLNAVFISAAVWSIAVSVSVAAAGDDAPIPAKVEFNRDIRPIFSDTCFKCHGFDENKRKKGLRLDTADGAFKQLKSGGTPIVAGHPDQSEAYVRIMSGDPDELMPPADSGLKITGRQKQLIKKWIEQGAAYQAHWAFITPTRPELPAVQHKTWVKNPIDAFVLAKLEAEHLKPSPEADKTTLIRRASLDLIGLPPTVEEIDAFVHDASPAAYEKVIDRLLASPRYGERMAMQWLDGARYADSNGYQADYERYQWPWRDWVIKAFNDNKRFDQFTIEQLAGDLLPNATIDQKVATGFNRNHRINTEGGIIADEWRVETVIDRVETTSAVWLGLTMGCCRCHDHKFDPVTQKEFYQFYAFFNSVNESGIGAEKPINHPPLARVISDEQRAKFDALSNAALSAEKYLRAEELKLPTMLAAWERTALDEKPHVRWEAIDADAMTATSGAKLTERLDQSVTVTGTNLPIDSYTIELTSPVDRITGMKLEALPDTSISTGGPGRSVNGNFVLTHIEVSHAGNPVKLERATSDFSQSGYPVEQAIGRETKNGWAIFPKVKESHFAIFSLETPIEAAGVLTIRLDFKSPNAQHQLGRFRLSVTDSKTPHEVGIPPRILTIIHTPIEKRTVKQISEIAEYFRLNHSGEVLDADRAFAKARAARDEFDATLPSVMVMEELPRPRDSYFLIRGQYDHKGEKVQPGTPAALPPMPADAPMNRLGLARWIVDPKNPLTSRVAVNRFWERFFGVGLVKTSENFGSQAEWPSHPELLDWLATEFIRNGWDIKAIQKTIVMSATYRQSSALTPALVERDPENRLVARGPRFRVQAETVRDQALFIAGLLNEKVGGPSVRPYQPDGLWDEINVYGNLRNYKHDTNGNEYRRSLYTIWKRTSAPPGMTLFDMPSRELCTVRRSRTNTPLQALALLNDETYVEASRKLAEKMLTEGGSTPSDRLTYGFCRAIGRVPDSHELQLLETGLQHRLAEYRTDPVAAKALLAVGDSQSPATFDPAELAAYTTSGSIILNLDEAITKQ